MSDELICKICNKPVVGVYASTSDIYHGRCGLGLYSPTDDMEALKEAGKSILRDNIVPRKNYMTHRKLSFTKSIIRLAAYTIGLIFTYNDAVFGAFVLLAIAEVFGIFEEIVKK